MENGKNEEVEIAKPATSLEVVNSVLTIVNTNRPLIEEKKKKLSGAIATVREKIKVIETDAQDQYFNNLIVAAKKGRLEIENLRKAYTGPLNDWISAQIKPEKELEAEIKALEEMRNAKARRDKSKADEENAKIAKQKDKDLYEAEVKGKMKLNLEQGLVDKILSFEKGIDKYFMENLKPGNREAFEKQLKGTTPRLKEETYQSLIGADYDIKRMAPDDYIALRKRALAYEQWSFETIGKKYAQEATTILNKWIAKIPQRVKELELMAAGGEQSERVKAIVEERDALERADTEKAAELAKSSAATKINNEVQGEQMSATFKAQAQEQRVSAPTGTREGKFFILDNPYDTLQVAKIISSIIIHMIPNKSAEERIKMIVAHDDKGKPKVDADGDPVYTPQVAFWLNKAVDFGYKPDVPGLTQKSHIKTVAKA